MAWNTAATCTSRSNKVEGALVFAPGGGGSVESTLPTKEQRETLSHLQTLMMTLPRDPTVSRRSGPLCLSTFSVFTLEVYCTNRLCTNMRDSSCMFFLFLFFIGNLNSYRKKIVEKNQTDSRTRSAIATKRTSAQLYNSLLQSVNPPGWTGCAVSDYYTRRASGAINSKD